MLWKIRKTARKSAKMSENIRKRIGFCLIAAAALILMAGLLPLRSPSDVKYQASKQNPVYPEPLLHLSEKDLLNTGNTESLSEYPGIGEITAAAILAERRENGRFWFPEDILAVKGIGEKKLEKIRPLMITETGEREE